MTSTDPNKPSRRAPNQEHRQDKAIFSSAEFKAHFPALSDPQQHYLDNAATTQKPQCVIEAMNNYYSQGVGNAHRGSHHWGHKATQIIEACRQRCATWLNAKTASEIVFTQSCTAALNTLAHGLTAQLQAGDEIILSVLEHHANLVPWQELAKKKQLVLKFIPLAHGALDLQALDTLISDKTKIISISACSNTLGCVTDLAAINKVRPKGCLLIVDAAQYANHSDIDVQAMDCDALCFSAHKLFAPDGLGILYGKSTLLASLQPLLSGGAMIEQVDLESSRFLDAPHKFEAGSPNTAAIAGFAAALEFIDSWQNDELKLYKQTLCEQAHLGLTKIPGIELFSNAANPAGIITFSMQNSALNIELAHHLNCSNIAVRQGHHCTQPLLKVLNQKSLIRASLAPYNTTEDVKALLKVCEDFVSSLDAPKHAKLAHSEQSSAQRRNAEKENLEIDRQRAEPVYQAKNWQQRQKQLALWGKDIAPKPDIQKDAFLINGCESTLWVEAKQQQSLWYFRHDSDARLVKGLSALILSWVNGCSSDEINAFDFEAAMSKLQLENYLSPSRSNGIHHLIQQLKQLN